MTALNVINNGPTPPIDRDRIARELAGAVAGEVRFGLHDRMLYATDASIYQVEPLGVVIPADTDDAVRAVEFCAKHQLPVLPRGGGTSLAGQCTSRAVVIDFSPSCRDVLGVDADARRCRVEPGITIDELNDHLRAHGLFFAPDPATMRHANIGGCIGNNAAGARSIRYGRTSENVAGVDVALADGRRARFEQGAVADPIVRDLTERVVDVVRRNERLIRERFPKTVRRNAAYNLDLILHQLAHGGMEAVNLAHLMCGSEGTLAVTLGAELLLHPVPKSKGLAVIAFGSVDEAIDAVPDILESRPSAIELLDDVVIGLARANSEYRRYVEMMPTPRSGHLEAVLYVEYFSDLGPGEIEDKFADLGLKYSSVMTYSDAPSMERAWKLRKAGEPLLHGVAGARKPYTFVEDNAVPVERLGEFVRRFRDIVTTHGTRAAYFAHASVGVLHIRPMLDLHDRDDEARMHAIAKEVADLARELGGVMSGEHGDGRVRTPLLDDFYGPELMKAMREVKAIFDPEGRLNPGNIVESRPIESITAQTRIRPGDELAVIPDIDTYFTYDDQHGFDGAIEMCNGAGVCRKKRGGTMCPSYMATLDERHSTRGRGNALRLAISGQFSNDGPAWDDPGTIETLNLCLSCKACKSECPSNVDIARLKAEYAGQRHKNGKTPFQARFFGAVRGMSRLASITPGVANFMNETPPARALLERFVGIDRRRSLPRFARPLHHRWARRGDDGRPIVVLFGDCFSMYNEPGVGLATRRVLEAFGYRVELANVGCCGRAKISTGILDGAIEQIDGTIANLRPLLKNPRVAAMVVCEPSCLSAIKDDWLSLKLRTPRAEREAIASRSFLPEEFIEQHWDEHPRRPAFREPISDRVLFHGHCHQKALWGNESSSALLQRVMGSKVEVLDAGCCGMAGSFGFTTDRYDLSMKIGELALLPAVRDAAWNSSSVTLAPGTSCRHQILDGTGVHAKHPMELLAELIEPD